MANPLDRTWYNTLIDDDGSGTTGTVWNKAAVDGLLDSVDASLTAVVDKTGTPTTNSLAVFADGDTLKVIPAPAAIVADLNGGLNITSPNYASVQLNDSSQAVNQRIVRVANTGGSLRIQAISDGGASVGNDLVVARSGGLVLNAGQLTFPTVQLPSTDPYTLDDCRRGSWTPTVSSSGGGSGQTYTAQLGRYVKFGKEVNCWGYVGLATLGTLSYEVIIGGFPFMTESTGMYFVGSALHLNLAVAYSAIVPRISPGTNYAYLYGSKGPVSSMGTVTVGDLTPSAIFQIHLSYLTAN